MFPAIRPWPMTPTSDCRSPPIPLRSHQPNHPNTHQFGLSRLLPYRLTSPSLQPFLTNNHIQAPINPGGTTLTTGSSITSTIDDDDPKDNHILSQSNVAPRKPPPPQSPLRINSSAGIITTALEEQLAIQTADLQVQVRRATEGRIYRLVWAMLKTIASSAILYL